jgi:hypothetical protein
MTVRVAYWSARRSEIALGRCFVTVENMPNWCSNTITIRGPEPTLEALLSKVELDQEGYLDVLKSLWPLPLELHGTQSPAKYDPSNPEHRELMTKYGAIEWYTWACSERGWGTKWGDCSTTVLSRVPGEVSLGCETAWSPPVAGVLNVSREWGELAFCVEYSEPMMGFAGEMMIQNGAVVASREWEVELYDEEYEEGEPLANTGTAHPDSGTF